MSKSLTKYVVGVEGNVSCKINGGFYIKASGKSLKSLKIDDLVFCDFNGSYEDKGLKPSIETGFHRWLLNNLDINFVAHTHPVNTLKILCSNKVNEFSTSRIFPDQVVFNGPESCVVNYLHPGDDLVEGIKRSVLNYKENYNQPPKLILLKNHGIITIGKTITDCLISCEICEKAAEIFLGAFSDINYLSKQDIYRIINDENEKYRQLLINEK